MLSVAAGATSLGCVALAPAGAEDTGRWEALLGNAPASRAFPSAPRYAPVPGFQIVLPSAPVRIERPRSEGFAVPSSPAPRVAAAPPDPSKRENPLQALLRDPTLRYGDIVMFPDGPRVFKGEAGRRHSVHDFVAVAKTKDTPQGSRKTLLAMPVGENSAWSSDTSSRTDKVAGRVRDVETTGSITKTVTVRTGRGDVRVIQVP
jgi:hypothetical protein